MRYDARAETRGAALRAEWAMTGTGLRRISFVLLVALVIYVAFRAGRW